MYDHPFQITDKRSNNAFSFELRKEPTIWVPDIIGGGLDDVKIGNRVVFEDIDEHGNLKSCVGLKHFVRMAHPKTGKPIVIVDNHNHAFYFWHEALLNGIVAPSATLVHMDQHKDMRTPNGGPVEGLMEGLMEDLIEDPIDGPIVDLQKIFEYTNSVLNVGNYIPPAIQDGLIGEVVMVTSEKELNENATPASSFQHSSIILNLDLDFWAPEMDYIDRSLKDRVAREWMERADLITIATSPFFIDQSLALKTLRELLAPKDY